MRRTIPYLQYELGNDESEATLHVIAHTTFNILLFYYYYFLYIYDSSEPCLSQSLNFYRLWLQKNSTAKIFVVGGAFLSLNVVSMIKLWKVDIKVLWSILTIRTVFHIVFVYVSFN